MKQFNFVLFILCFSFSLSHAQVQQEHIQHQGEIDLNISVVKEKIKQLNIEHSSITFSTDFERKNLLSGEIIKVYQKIKGKKNTKNSVLFRFDKQNRLINQYESLAHYDEDIIYSKSINIVKPLIKNSKVKENVSRVEQYSVFSIDPTQGSQQVYSYAESEISLVNDEILCPTIEAIYPEAHLSEDITYDVESPGDNAYLLGDESTKAGQKKFAEIMCYHHLYSIDKYVKDQYVQYQSLGNNIPNYPITGKVGFDPRGEDGVPTDYDFLANSFNIHYPTRDVSGKDYAEDGYMIRREYFRGYHSFLHDGNQSACQNIDEGIADYFAYSSLGNSTSNMIHNWANNIELDINYFNTFTSSSQLTSSQSLSTVLWYMRNYIFDENRTTSIVFDVLPLLEGISVTKQYQAALAIYNTAINIPDFKQKLKNVSWLES